MSKTSIEYADWSFNPITGCTLGCKYCYARRMTKRFEKVWGYDFTPRLHPERLDKHDNWKPGDRVFVCDMGDWLDDKVERSWVEQILRVIVDNPKVTFLMLTKQPQNFEDKVYGDCEEYPCRVLGGGDYFPNLWHGTTITCQADADKRIPELLKVPAIVRWVSVEPMLGPVKMNFIGCPNCGKSQQNWFPNYTICKACGMEVKSPPDNMISWVVCGGMSGPSRKLLNLKDARKLRDDCAATNTPFFMKQVDKKIPIPDDLMVREYPQVIA